MHAAVHYALLVVCIYYIKGGGLWHGEIAAPAGKASTFTACPPTTVGWEQTPTLNADLTHLMVLRRQANKKNTNPSSFPIDSVPIGKRSAF